jgi:NAD+ kinase
MTKILVVLKDTPYRAFTRHKDRRVLKLLRAKDPMVLPLVRADRDHEATVRELEAALKSLGAKAKLTHDPAAAGGKFDLVVTVGGDGTLLKTSHHVGPGTAVVAINSAPKSSVGFFSAGAQGNVKRVLADALSGKLRKSVLARMRVERNGRVLEKRVLNEVLFCHMNPAATSRYVIRLEDGKRITEDQRSSGVWIGPPAGSTAAIRSAGGRLLPLESRTLQLVVREPYRPHGERVRLKKGLVPEGSRLVLTNKMHSARIFVDGHQREHECEMGDVLAMEISDEPLLMLGMRRR